MKGGREEGKRIIGKVRRRYIKREGRRVGRRIRGKEGGREEDLRKGDG